MLQAVINPETKEWETLEVIQDKLPENNLFEYKADRKVLNTIRKHMKPFFDAVFVMSSMSSTYTIDEIAELFPDVITDRQLAHGLAKAGLISMAEAKAWVGPGTLPAALAGFIAAMPEAMRDDVEIVLIGATSFSRKHPLTETFGQAVGMTPQQLDQFWMMCASL
jgi:hypothetical protein